MLPKLNRFTTSLFDRFFRRSKRFTFFPYTFLVSDNKRGFKGAVVVGKKISKSAVKRNRLRRQLYAVMEQVFLPKNPPKNIICLYQGPDKLEKSTDFFKVCQQLLSKI